MHEEERARKNLPAPGRALQQALIALAGAWFLSSAGAAGTQFDVLAYEDPAVADLREDFALRQRALAGLPGLHVSVTASPSVSYGTLAAGEVIFWNDPALEATPAWSTGLYVGATFGYSFDRVARLNDRAALLQAGADVASAARRGVFQALDLHAQLLQAQLAKERDAIQVGASAANAARLGTSQARLLHAALRLQQDEDGARLADLRRRADGYGLAPEAAYAPLRFALPEPALERTVRYRLAVLERERTRAQRDDDLAYGTVQGLAATATRVSGGVSLAARAGVIDARPGAEFTITYPAGTDGWAVDVSATFSLSSDLTRIAQDEREAQRARARVEALVRDFPAQAERLRVEAVFAERGLALAEQRLALAEGALAEAAPPGGDYLASADPGPAGLVPAPVDRTRAQAETANAMAALFQSWARYVRSVYSFLDYVEAPWEARTRE